MIDFINPTRFSLCLNSVTGSKFLGSGGWGVGSMLEEIRAQRSEFGDRTPDSRVESPEVQKFRVLVHHLKTNRIKSK